MQAQDHVVDNQGQTWEEFSQSLFEYEYCGECYGDAEDHVACLDPFGNWFAMCKFSPLGRDWALRNGRLQRVATA